MIEHLTRAMYGLDIHLLYASIVCLAAWVLTASRSISATAKYWILVAASLNFFLPLGAVLDGFGASHVGWASPLGFIGDAAAVISRSLLFWLLWGVGTSLMLVRLCVRLFAGRRVANSVTTSAPKPLAEIARGIAIKFTDERRSPAVEGILRPFISIPRDIEHLLNGNEIEAVLLHEFIHARRRDNLIRLVQEIGQCLLWWHPLVWLTGRRLALYRELSCDEAVIRQDRNHDLVSALAKLAEPDGGFILRANFSSFMSDRLAQLSAHSKPARRAAGVMVALLFSTLLCSGIFATISHTACCFIAHR